jgi:hypothetical protein
MVMTRATQAARTAAQLREAAREVARVAARRSGGAEAQISVSSVRQRLELAITKADCLLAGHAQESWSRDGSDWLGMLRELCAEIVEAARDYLYAEQSAECQRATDSGCEPLSEYGQSDEHAHVAKKPLTATTQEGDTT